jgi:hypothetical protein
MTTIISTSSTATAPRSRKNPELRTPPRAAIEPSAASVYAATAATMPSGRSDGGSSSRRRSSIAHVWAVAAAKSVTTTRVFKVAAPTLDQMA